MKTLVLGAWLIVGVGIVLGQESTFEVASVKRNTSGDTNGMLRQMPGGRVMATNMPVRQVIQFSYGVAGYQLVGGVVTGLLDPLADDRLPFPPAAPEVGHDQLVFAGEVAVEQVLATAAFVDDLL